MATPVLTLDHVEVRRGMSVVLKQHTLEVNGGDLVALVGANGAGKSTLLETAATLLPLEHGSVKHGNVVVMDAEGRRTSGPHTVGVVLQKNGMLGSEVVEEHLLLACSKSGSSIDVHPFLDALNLRHRAQDLVAHLSQGQARKVAVLAGLLPAFASQEPCLVLLDEPAAGLDDEAVSTVCQWMAQLRNEGHALLVCTHDERIRRQATFIHDVSEQTSTAQTPEDTSTTMAATPVSTRPTSRGAFGVQTHMRTMLWLNTNGMAALLTLGVLLSLGSFMDGFSAMQRLGAVLAPALAAGLCGEPLVAAMREERASTWWRAIDGGVPHASWLPIVLGVAITAVSTVGLQQPLAVEHLAVGGGLCWTVWHVVRWSQRSTERLARPQAALIGLLTPVLILPYALLLDILTR
jgi:ABC-type lipoprotein export system ATPase subunit